MSSHPPRPTARSRLPFALRQLHSLTGVVPVGVLMLALFGSAAKAGDGPRAFADALGWLRRMPLAAQVGLGLAFAFHALFGVFLAVRSQYSVVRYPYSKNWQYALQRASGLCALVFTGWLAVRFGPMLRAGATLADVHASIERALTSTWHGAPLAAFGWLLGVAACAFHLGNGLPSFCARWGLTPLRWQRRAAAAFGAIVGLSAFAVGGQTIVAVATGWHMIAASAPARAGDCGAVTPR